jgi:hypothetical protein
MVPIRKLLSSILALSFTIRQKVKLNALECEYGVPVMFPYSFKCRLTDTEIFALRYCVLSALSCSVRGKITAKCHLTLGSREVLLHYRLMSIPTTSLCDFARAAFRSRDDTKQRRYNIGFDIPISTFVALELQGSSRHSKEPATGPYPEPVESTSPPSQIPYVPFWSHSTLTPMFYEWSLSFGVSHQNLVQFSLLSHTYHMSRPPHSPWFNLSNDIWIWVQIMKLLIVQLPPLSCYVSPLRSKYSSQNPVLKHPLLLLWETTFHIRTKQLPTCTLIMLVNFMKICPLV